MTPEKCRDTLRQLFPRMTVEAQCVCGFDAGENMTETIWTVWVASPETGDGLSVRGGSAELVIAEMNQRMAAQPEPEKAVDK